MKKQLTLTKAFYGKTITADVVILDEGVNVLLTGGERTHIGAVSVISPDGQEKTLSFDGHKEALLSAQWAEKIAKKRIPVAVEAGIHYDNATPEQIQEILTICDEMLHELLEIL